MKTKMLVMLSLLLVFNGSTKAGWVTSGNNMYSDLSGNVGIGTTNPVSKLHVKGSGWPNSFLYLDTDAVGQESGIRLYENGTIKGYLYHSGVSDMLHIFGSNFNGITINSNGDVGIGLGTGNPITERLDLSQAGGVNARIGKYNYLGTFPSIPSFVLGNNVRALTNGFDGIEVGNPYEVGYRAIVMSPYGGIQFCGFAGQVNAGISLLNTDYSLVNERMRITNDGNVGIGTTSPGARLEVDSGSADTSGLRFTKLTSTSPVSPTGTKILSVNASGDVILVQDSIGISGTSGQTLRHNGTNWITNSLLFNDGTNVGIGTTSLGTNRLKVAGNIDSTGYTEGGSNVLSNDISGNAANADKVDGYHAGNSSGQVAVNNGTICTSLNADLLDGQHAADFLTSNGDFGRSGVSSILYEGATPLSSKYLGISDKATNSDKLDNLDSTDFAIANHNHNDLYYTKTELQTSGTASVNWHNIIDVPSDLVRGSGTVDRVVKFTGTTAVGDSVIYESVGNIGIGAPPSSVAKLGTRWPNQDHRR